jgi:hypothetical protein
MGSRLCYLAQEILTLGFVECFWPLVQEKTFTVQLPKGAEVNIFNIIIHKVNRMERATSGRRS